MLSSYLLCMLRSTDHDAHTEVQGYCGSTWAPGSKSLSSGLVSGSASPTEQRHQHEAGSLLRKNVPTVCVYACVLRQTVKDTHPQWAPTSQSQSAPPLQELASYIEIYIVFIFILESTDLSLKHNTQVNTSSKDLSTRH